MPVVPRCVWEFLGAGVIASGGIIIALGAWPTAYQWLVIGTSFLIAGVKGVNALQATPPK